MPYIVELVSVKIDTHTYSPCCFKEHTLGKFTEWKTKKFVSRTHQILPPTLKSSQRTKPYPICPYGNTDWNNLCSIIHHFQCFYTATYTQKLLKPKHCEVFMSTLFLRWWRFGTFNSVSQSTGSPDKPVNQLARGQEPARLWLSLHYCPHLFLEARAIQISEWPTHSVRILHKSFRSWIWLNSLQHFFLFYDPMVI